MVILLIWRSPDEDTRCGVVRVNMRMCHSQKLLRNGGYQAGDMIMLLCCLLSVDRGVETPTHWTDAVKFWNKTVRLVSLLKVRVLLETANWESRNQELLCLRISIKRLFCLFA